MSIKFAKKINVQIRYTKEQKRYLKSLQPYSGELWEKDDQQLKSIKRFVRTQLEKIQKGYCAYCGLRYDETSWSEIEHIAPKGGAYKKKYPQFMFTPLNLTLACPLCNGFTKKGNKDTIAALGAEYKQCQFNIVHPYLDDPDDHFEWIPSGSGVIIQYKSIKGSNSIKMFCLDKPVQCEARAKQVMFEEFKRAGNIEKILMDISSFKA